MDALVAAIRVIIGCVFVIAAILKIHSGVPTVFERSLYSRFVAGRLLVHLSIVGSELMLGCLLIFGVKIRATALVTCLILSMMSGVMLAEMTRFNPAPCGCFGSPTMVANFDVNQIPAMLTIGVVRNLSMAAGLVLVALRGFKDFRADHFVSQ